MRNSARPSQNSSRHPRSQENPTKTKARHPYRERQEAARHGANPDCALSLQARAKKENAATGDLLLASLSVDTLHAHFLAGDRQPETPIIAITLEDTVNIDKDGATRVVIPQASNCTGWATESRARFHHGVRPLDFVWRTNSEQNSMTLSVAGTALTRDYDETRGIWGPDEKKAGIKGHRFQSISESAVKLVLLDAIAAMTRKLKDYNPVINPLTNQTVNQEVPGVKMPPWRAWPGCR
ncbi:hypothetical protein OH491_27655 (plasmid) [Termitidicoccus mucosus]|uniref:hypothetical protein n=1 Tax=Termitidicoccus mucosus TaxID=1184151 RepID=UPI003184281D